MKILLAQKAFSCFDVYPLVAKYLDGTTASGLFEARLAHEEMPERENHVFNPAFTEEEMAELVRWCDHIVFNSVAQWKRFRDFPGLPSAALRVNHGYSEIEHDIYNPCVAGSRLGVPRAYVRPKDIEGLDGLHFHTMCEQGADVLGVGEMGIGNTTTSAAVLSVLTGTPVSGVTGRGGGITDAAYQKKLTVIEEAIERNRPDPSDPVDVLAKVGGFDLAAMTGAFLGAAKARVPAVTDGFISVVAALCAVRLCPETAAFLIPSHASTEIGYSVAMRALGQKPLFELGMRLGEGSGCPIAMTILDAACAAMNDMATFSEAQIDDGYLDPIHAGDSFTVKGGNP